MHKSSLKIPHFVYLQLNEIIIKFHDLARNIENLEGPSANVAATFRHLGDCTAILQATCYESERQINLPEKINVW
jgi:hypothetical protein